MKKGQIITYKQTTEAAFSVQDELFTIGLWHEECRLNNVEIYWCRLPQITMYDALGFFMLGASKLDKFLGYESGHIYIPAFVLSHLFWQSRGSLRDIIRHEYAHAFAHHYPELIINSKEFETVFNGHYYSELPTEMEDEAYLTEYAKTMPMEDFAETFMVFVRRKGIMPSTIKNTKLKKKWNFIAKKILKAS
jgi:hypothetical protein